MLQIANGESVMNLKVRGLNILAMVFIALLSARPLLAQSDGDGVPDAWKNTGAVTITSGNGSSQKLDLTKDGPAGRGQKDVYVWVAWMENSNHTHKPDPEAIVKIKAAFSDGPVKNANGTTGIRLHVFYNSQAIPEVPVLGSVDANNNYVWTEFDKLKAHYFPKELAGVFHFCVFAHDIDAEHHSGISKAIGGYDFIVSLGAFGANGHVADSESQAGTFMHELGHNLGLRHGGGDDINYKPNYISVMNYFFQLSGIPVNLETGTFDYSRFDVGEDEHNLDRKTGLNVTGSLAKYGTQYFCAANDGISQSVDSIGGAIDWDCSGQLTGIAQDDTNADGILSLLDGYDDWEHIRLVYAAAAAGVTPPAKLRLKDELTLEQANKISIPPVPNVLAVPVANGVLVSWKKIPLDRVVAYRVVRKSSGGAEQIIGVTEGSGLVDKTPSAGKYEYFVRGLYTPFGNPARTELGFPEQDLSRLVDDVQSIAAIRQDAPKGISKIETMGLKPNVVKKPVVNLLIETSLSRGASIQVQ